MDNEKIIAVIGCAISLIAAGIGFFSMEFMLRHNYPKIRIFLLSQLPGVFVTIGMVMLLSGAPSSSEYAIPLNLYLFCAFFWIILWVILTYYMIISYAWRPKVSPLLEWVNRITKKRK